MDISIVVPVYNTAPYLVRCIEALESQDYPRQRYQIIMVDNNSTDGSESIIRSYPSVHVLRETKQGSYAARNCGVREAVGSIIAFTDSDCAPQSDWLRKIADEINGTGAGIALGRTLPARDSYFMSVYEAYQHHRRKYIFDSKIRELYFSYTGNMAVRRELLDLRMPFVERPRGADVIFVRETVDKYSCDIVRYCPKMQVRHLEINSVRDVYKKLFIYGRNRGLYSQISHRRPLEFSEWLTIFGRTRRAEGFSLLQSAMLLELIAFGWAVSQMGRLSGTVTNRLPVPSM